MRAASRLTGAEFGFDRPDKPGRFEHKAKEDSHDLENSQHTGSVRRTGGSGLAGGGRLHHASASVIVDPEFLDKAKRLKLIGSPSTGSEPYGPQRNLRPWHRLW